MIFSVAAIVVEGIGTAERLIEVGKVEEKVEEWDTNGTFSEFLSSFSLCVPETVCVSVSVCIPYLCILALVSETSVISVVLSNRVGFCGKSVGSGISVRRVTLSARVGDTEVREEGGEVTKGETDFGVERLTV